MIGPADAPLAWLSEYARQYPDAWRGIERLRGARGRGLPNWPGWCYVPLAAGVAAVTGGADLDGLDANERADWAHDAAVVTALSAWRQTKGVYVLDPDLLEALWSTPLTGDVPSAVLKRLPEWCVYVHLADRPMGQEIASGFWTHLEADVDTNREELRFVLAGQATVTPLTVHLVGSLSAGIEAALVESNKHSPQPLRGERWNYYAREMRALTEPLVNLVLYLCSEAPEIEGKGKPGNPRPQKVKGGTRTFPAPGPRLWSVGSRIGAALRAARDRNDSEPEVTATGRARPRPHIRRAHWAVRWTGPRTGEQTPVLRWLAPTLVAADTGEELPAVVHRVE